MKPTPVELSRLAEGLREFITMKGWSHVRSTKGLDFYAPPQSLGIEGKYTVALPMDVSKSGISSFLYSAANALVDIYGYGGLSDLLDRAALLSDQSQPTRLTTRFVDKATRTGAIPLSSLVSFTTNIEAGLYRSAKFKLGIETKETKLIAERFVKECNFLQTEKGSFVTRLEIPQTTLRQGDLFGREPIVSTEVCSSLFSAISFLNQRIIGGDDSFDTEDMLREIITLFDVELLESLTKVLTGPDMESIDFSLQIGNDLRTSSTGWLSEDKRNRLRQFLEFIRDKLRGEEDLVVTGSIVELRSRDPDGNRNYIRVVGDFHGDKTFISATLTNEQYQHALDAHRNKRLVRLRGNGTRLKTQIRIVDVTEFSG